MTAREVARYDANTLRSVRAIDLHNVTPSAELGGVSPYDLVYGPREEPESGESEVVENLAYDALFDARPGRIRVYSSSVHIEELEDSEQKDSSDSSSDERMEDESSGPPRDSLDPLENPEVSRHERAVLLRMFKKEQRLSRKQYRGRVRGMWEADVAEDKENRPSQEEGKRGEPIITQPVDPEVEEEAFEDFLFDRMLVRWRFGFSACSISAIPSGSASSSWRAGSCSGSSPHG